MITKKGPIIVCHYANMPMQYTVILKAVKMIMFSRFFFVIFVRNIDRENTLEPPH